jgi:hypothetical protein
MQGIHKLLHLPINPYKIKDMNRISIYSFLFLSLAFSACQDKYIEEVTYTANVPIYSATNELNLLIGSEGAKPLESPGKLHLNGTRLFIVDQFKGIHVFDNANPTHPINLAYIVVPGVIDIATRGSVLYADSYDDLVSLDISDIQDVRIIDRDEGMFIQVLPPTNNDYPIVEIDPAEGVVISWKQEEITEKREVDQWSGRGGFGIQEDFSSATNDGISPLSSPKINNGTSGSMARFSVYGSALYALNESELQTFDLSDISNPQFISANAINRVVETIFPMDEKLFIGTTTGMAIYGLDNPLNPSFISDFNHVSSCDPVVVEDDVAYVTLRTGSNCGGWVNQLDLLDVSNISSPSLIASYQMTNPHGLGINDNVLFICDGADGLKIYDATDKWNITANQIAHFSDIQSYDVIPLESILLMIGEDGFFQYDYSDLENIQLISQIQVQ